MMIATAAKDCGPLGEIVERVSNAVTRATEEFLTERPELEIVFVVVPGGNIQGGAVLNARKPLPNMDGVMLQLDLTQEILRQGADSCGRCLFQSPAAAHEVAVESAFIIQESRDAFEDWRKKRCEHPEHGVREAATMIATGIRILAELGAPELAVAELTRLCKEVCRRTHISLFKIKARSHAQA